MILFSTIVASLYIFLEFLYFLGNHFVISVSPNLENTPCQIITIIIMVTQHIFYVCAAPEHQCGGGNIVRIGER